MLSYLALALPKLWSQPYLSHLGLGNLFLWSHLQLGNPVLLDHSHRGYVMGALPSLNLLASEIFCLVPGVPPGCPRPVRAGLQEPATLSLETKSLGRQSLGYFPRSAKPRSRVLPSLAPPLTHPLIQATNVYRACALEPHNVLVAQQGMARHASWTRGAHSPVEGVKVDLIHFNDVTGVTVGWSKFQIPGEHLGRASNSCPGGQGLSSSASGTGSKLKPERRQDLVNRFKWGWQISRVKTHRESNSQWEIENINMTGAAGEGGRTCP